MKENNRDNLNKSLAIEIDKRVFEPEAVFIDLDGTLLDKFTKKISKKNIEAIKKQQQKCPVIISTGRSYEKKVKKIMKLLDIKYAICQNGAVVADNQGNILRNITLDRNQSDEIVKIVKEVRLGFTINSEFLIYTDHWLWATLRFLWRKKWKRINKFSFDDKPINKVVIAGYLKKKKVWALADKISKTITHASVKTSGGDKVIEITNDEATKGTASNFIAKLLNINIRNTVHIGDSENDSTTIEFVGALIAMKNSSQKLFDKATHIGPNHKRSGVYKILEEGNFYEIKKH